MKAWLINPAEIWKGGSPFEEIEFHGNYKQIQQVIGCRVFDVVRLDNGDGIYVDDEGLYSGAADRDGWMVINGHLLAGRGVVLGSDEEGNSMSPYLDRAWLEKNVRLSDGWMVVDHTGKLECMFAQLLPSP